MVKIQPGDQKRHAKRPLIVKLKDSEVASEYWGGLGMRAGNRVESPYSLYICFPFESF